MVVVAVLLLLLLLLVVVVVMITHQYRSVGLNTRTPESSGE